MPVDMGDGVYTLIIDANGDADSVGSPGPYSALGENDVCFGSVEGEEGRNEFGVELECHSLADLGGATRSYEGAVTVEPPAPVSSVLDCEEGPGILVIAWHDGTEDALCWTGEA
jgi:hypothetical protein